MSNNCSQSSTIKSTLVNGMTNCSSPVHHVMHTIGEHSKKLFRAVKNLQDKATGTGGNGLVIREPDDINYDTCLCSDSTLSN